MAFSNEWIEELIAKVDIVQTISAYVPLKRLGRNYVGLCPFHKEKTASFNVSAEKQFYYCFGCKASGNVIKFIMEKENLPFPEACKHLAEQHNIPLPEESNDLNYIENKNKKDRIWEANKLAAALYHKMLWQSEGKAVLEYFRARGLNDTTIIKFGLGASCEKDIVLERLTKEGFLLQELLDANLVMIKNGKPRDVFKNRAIFPIVDVHKKVLGFGGRALNDEKPKYLNTSDTPVFNKRKNVYGLNLFRSKKSFDRVILVEGYMDVIALNQYGIEGVVATLGTALTPEQARLLSRFGTEIYICYDGDVAGKKATDRAVRIVEDEANVHTRVLEIPDGKDPDEYVRENGVRAFESLMPLHNKLYLIERLKENYNLSDDFQKTQFQQKSVEILLKIENGIELNNILDKACTIMGISKELLLSELNKQRPEATRGFEKAHLKKEVRTQVDAHLVPKSEQQLISIMALNRLPFDTINTEIFSNAQAQKVFEKLKIGMSIQQILNDIEDTEYRTLFSNVFMNEDGDFPTMSDGELMTYVEESIGKNQIPLLQKRLEKVKQELNVVLFEPKTERTLQRTLELSNEQKNINEIIKKYKNTKR